MSDRTLSTKGRLTALRDLFQYWLTWNQEERAKEDLQVNDDVYVIQVPGHWPTRGSIKRWIETIDAASAALPSEPSADVKELMGRLAEKDAAQLHMTRLHDELVAAALDYNGLLRSFHSIAGRCGAATNWEGLQARIRDVLDKHHATWLRYAGESVPVEQPPTKDGNDHG